VVVALVVVGLHLDRSNLSPAAAATPGAVSPADAPGATTLAGTGTPGQPGPVRTATEAPLSSPAGIAEDTAGDLFIADAGACRVEEVAAHDGTGFGRHLVGGTLVTVAGGSCTTSGAPPSPTAVAVDAAGDLFVASGPGDRVEEVPTADGTHFGVPMEAGHVYTVAGDGRSGSSGDGGRATAARLDDPTGVAVDGSGDLFIADTADDRVRMVPDADRTHFGVAMQDGHIYTVAGDGLTGSSGDGGPADQARLWDPGALAVDGAGDVYIADQGNRSIRVLTTHAGTFFGVGLGSDDLGTVAGEGSYGPYLVDGLPAVGDTGELNFPTGLALDRSGDLYVADGDMHAIRYLAAGTTAFRGQSTTVGSLYTAAGAYAVGSLRDRTTWVQTRLGDPTGLAVSPAGRLVYSDSAADVVRELPAGT
jgi:DNA-binding beta-propeller fold protein YncE